MTADHDGNLRKIDQIVGGTPGLHRGFAAAPEVYAEEKAFRLRTEASEHAALGVIAVENSRYLRLPPIFSEKPVESWMPRYDPETGYTYTSKWKMSQGFDVDDPSKFKVFSKAGWVKREVDLGKVPKSWSVALLIPQEIRNLESALRQQDYIRHDYGRNGTESSRVMEVMGSLRQLSVAFLTGEINALNLQDYQQEMVELLEANSLLRPNDSIWQSIAQKASRIAQRDSRGRLNTPEPL